MSSQIYVSHRFSHAIMNLHPLWSLYISHWFLYAVTLIPILYRIVFVRSHKFTPRFLYHIDFCTLFIQSYITSFPSPAVSWSRKKEQEERGKTKHSRSRDLKTWDAIQPDTKTEAETLNFNRHPIWSSQWNLHIMQS